MKGIECQGFGLRVLFTAGDKILLMKENSIGKAALNHC
jgi:hypothetical protein